jgi:adenosine deaminase
MKKVGDIRQVPTGRQLEQDLSIHGHKSQKSTTSGELMAQSNLATYQEQYAALTNIAKTAEGALLTYYQLMLEQATHGVQYVEFRTGLPSDCDPETFILNCMRGCQEAQRQLAVEQKSVDYGFLVLINRGAPTTPNPGSGLAENIHRGMVAAQAAIDLNRAGYPVVGIDLAGNELDNAVTDFAPVFQRIHAHNSDPQTPPANRLGITIHSGETKTSRDQNNRVLSGYESVAASVAVGWSPETTLRIGHGVRIIEHPAVAQAFAAFCEDPTCAKDTAFRGKLFTQAPLLKTLQTHQICLETCPTSNVQTSAVTSYEGHPARFFEALGLSVTINPDNTVISRTDATNEFVKLFKRQGFYQPEKSLPEQQAALVRFEGFMQSCYQHGVRAAFIVDDLQKQRLLNVTPNNDLSPKTSP